MQQNQGEISNYVFQRAWRWLDKYYTSASKILSIHSKYLSCQVRSVKTISYHTASWSIFVHFLLDANSTKYFVKKWTLPSDYSCALYHSWEKSLTSLCKDNRWYSVVGRSLKGRGRENIVKRRVTAWPEIETSWGY